MTDDQHLQSLDDALRRIADECQDNRTNTLIRQVKDHIEHMRTTHTSLTPQYIEEKEKLEQKIHALKQHIRHHMDTARAEGLIDWVKQDAEVLVQISHADYS